MEVILPYEILAEIAMHRRDVYLATSSTCARLRRELSLSRAMTKFVRRYVFCSIGYGCIRDRMWCSTDDIGDTVIYWIHERMLEHRRKDGGYTYIQYAWDREGERDSTMRRISEHRVGEDMTLRYEPITPCNTFEAVINELCDHDDLCINTYP